ncbi:quinone oxidoreductase family protein [Lacticaseibacillus brantae]|uniref:Zinc-containing alcohol dehydrogenase n=1 Tax=Lacticaseibacillus brantae DSM 23927 TaxID=1423727 RepID=A0A0R2B6C2_9LACO|nr:zinc-binding dehydrogenase [Lacticaseibacillus brantae]KRM71171.1 zinc-containing alcohol dehydrogenase [Lacticaseibacillus brantae DSM 23927]
MQAIVVRNFNYTPQFEHEYPAPKPTEQETLIQVQAAALSQRAKSGADGSHYSSKGALPMVPGVDGVGTLPDGQQVYFVANGSFAEQVAVRNGFWVPVPAQLDPVKIAGMMNPAMSSWMALQYRAHIQSGQKVMILGATGTAGQMAVQIAKRLGASEVIAVGRNTTKLEALSALGATQLINLSADSAAADLANAGQDVDIVLDYLWGAVTPLALKAIVPHRLHDDQPLKWVEIGGSAGTEAMIPAAAFRAVALEMVGSGQGSVGVTNILETLKAIVASEATAPFTFATQTAALADVDHVWSTATKSRLVFVP